MQATNMLMPIRRINALIVVNFLTGSKIALGAVLAYDKNQSE